MRRRRRRSDHQHLHMGILSSEPPLLSHFSYLHTLFISDGDYLEKTSLSPLVHSQQSESISIKSCLCLNTLGVLITAINDSGCVCLFVWCECVCEGRLILILVFTEKKKNQSITCFCFSFSPEHQVLYAGEVLTLRQSHTHTHTHPLTLQYNPIICQMRRIASYYGNYSGESFFVMLNFGNRAAHRLTGVM